MYCNSCKDGFKYDIIISEINKPTLIKQVVTLCVSDITKPNNFVLKI